MDEGKSKMQANRRLIKFRISSQGNGRRACDYECHRSDLQGKSLVLQHHECDLDKLGGGKSVLGKL
jgi:hypothetical protein